MPSFHEAAPQSAHHHHHRDDDGPARLKAAVDPVSIIESATGRHFLRRPDCADSTCPWCQDPGAKERKFRVWSGGGYYCAKTPDHRGGDVLAFLRAWHGWTFSEALDELRRVTGGEAPARDHAKLRAETEAADRRRAAERAAAVASARALWAEASPELPPEAVAYWREARGLPGVPPGLRWHPSCPYGPGTLGATLAPIVDAAGELVAVHRIPPVAPPDAPKRMMLGPVGGGAVRLGTGPTLVLAEGVETAAAASALLNLPAWAALDAGNLPRQTLPAEVTRVVIIADHDKPNEEGKGPHTGEGGTGWAAARKAAAEYARPGRRVEIWTTPEVGTDANDSLLGKAGPLYLLESVEPAPVAAEVSPNSLEGPEAPGPAPAPRPAPIVLPAFAAPHELDNAAALVAADRELRELVREAVRFAAGGPDMEGAEPPRTLVNVTVGVGKSEAYIRGLAEASYAAGFGGPAAGDVLVVVPNIDLGEELKVRLEAAIAAEDERRWREAGGKAPMALSPVDVRVWRGRTKERFGEPKGGERMCARPKDVVERVQKSGAKVRKALCGGCPFKDGCSYLAQAEAVKRGEARNFLIMSHEHLFLNWPEGFKPRLVIVDEGLGDRMVRQWLIRPEDVTDPTLWADSPELLAHAATVAAALREVGRELAELRARGVTVEELGACAGFLRGRLATLRAAVEDAEGPQALETALAAVEAARYGKVAALFAGLAVELGHERDGANGNRLELRPFKLTEADDDSAEWVEEERFVAREIRRWRVPAGAAVVWADATANRELVERFARKPFAYVEHNVPLKGTVLQVHNTTNSKYRLLGRKEAAGNLANMAQLVRDLHTSSGGSLFVGATLKVKNALREAIGRDCPGTVWMHFSGDKGSDAAKACKVGLVIGREEPRLSSVEDAARCFAVERPEPFISAPAGRGGRPDLVPAVRSRLMKDGTHVEAEVSTHPDPLGRAVLEQVREASMVQSLGRMRQARGDGKLTVLASRIPVPVAVDRLVGQHELERVAGLAVKARSAVAASGVYLFDWKAEGFAKVEHARPFVGVLAAFLGALPKLAQTRYESPYRLWASFSAYPGKLRGTGRGPRRDTWVVSPLPAAEAFAAAKAAGYEVEPIEPFPAEPAPAPIVRSGAGTLTLTAVLTATGGPTPPFVPPPWTRPPGGPPGHASP